MRRYMILAASVAMLGSVSLAHAQNEGVELGVLDCQAEGGTSFIVGSTKNVTCTYTPADTALAPETYNGSIEKIGLDVGTTDETRITWAVLAPSQDLYAPGALAGDYVGASAEATVGVGAGVNLLVGGSNKSFTLQPLSVQTQTGLNLALGVTEFRLHTAAN